MKGIVCMHSALLSTAVTVPAVIGLLAFAGPSHAEIASEGKKPGPRSATSEMVFDCLLLPFQSAFRYEGAFTVSGPKRVAAGEPIQLTGSFPDLPGIAPVEIVDGTMRAAAQGTVGDTPFELTTSMSVSAAAKADVPMDDLTSTVTLADEKDPITLTSFRFEFDEMMGLNISAECNANRGRDLGPLATGAKDEGAAARADVVAADNAEESGTDVAALALWGVPTAVAVAIGGFILSARVRRRA